MQLIGQPKVNKVNFFLPFSKFMKRAQTKFHAHTMRESQVVSSKKVKIYRWFNFSCNTVFFSSSVFY